VVPTANGPVGAGNSKGVGVLVCDIATSQGRAPRSTAATIDARSVPVLMSRHVVQYAQKVARLPFRIGRCQKVADDRHGGGAGGDD